MLCVQRRLLFLVVVLAAPTAVLAQAKDKVWRVGFLASRHVSPDPADYYYAPFRESMRDIGYVEGRNLVIEWRSAEGHAERLPKLAQELVRSKVDVIVASGTQATAAAKGATTTIPIVMGSTVDPVGTGFVKMLARPGGNITGLSTPSSATASHRLEVLAAFVPNLKLAAVLANPDNPANMSSLHSLQVAGKKAGVQISAHEARSLQQIDAAFAQVVAESPGGVIILGDAVFSQNARRIAQLALQHHLPSVFSVRRNVQMGGLVSYGPNVYESARRTALFVDKILRGANPAELPVEQTTSYEIALNRRTAKALGLAIPSELLERASHIVE